MRVTWAPWSGRRIARPEQPSGAQKIDSNGNPVCAAAGGRRNADAGTPDLLRVPASAIPCGGFPSALVLCLAVRRRPKGNDLGYLHWNDDGTHGNFAIVPQVIPAGWSGGAVSFTYFVRGFDHHTHGE